MSDQQARLRRKLRVEQMLKDGLPNAEIAAREGLELTNMSAWLKNNGLAHLKPKVQSRTPTQAYGLTSESARMRSRLSKKIAQLRDQYPAEDVAGMTGISEMQQNRTIYSLSASHHILHDFTISQIERLAAALGMTFKELMDYALQDPNPS